MPSILKRVAKGASVVTKPLVNRYNQAQAEKKAYEKRQYERENDPEVQLAREGAYRKAALANAEAQGIADYNNEKVAKGQRGRQSFTNFMGDLSGGSARALSNPDFGIGSSKNVLGSIEGFTGMGNSGAILGNIENMTGMGNPRRVKEAAPSVAGGKGGTTVVINMGSGNGKRKSRGFEEQVEKRQRDWQDDVAEVTGF